MVCGVAAHRHSRTGKDSAMTNNARHLAVGMAEHLIENEGKCPVCFARQFLREINHTGLFKPTIWQRAKSLFKTR